MNKGINIIYWVMQESIMGIEVIDVFHTNIGVIAILNFPQEISPRINMVLKKGSYMFEIKGISFSQPNAFESINNKRYSCLLSVGQWSVSPGDVLEMEC